MERCEEGVLNGKTGRKVGYLDPIATRKTRLKNRAEIYIRNPSLTCTAPSYFFRFLSVKVVKI